MMLCGRAPFEGTMLPGLLYNIVNTAPPSLREGRPEIPQEVEDAVMVALRKDPARRHQTMEPFWQAFSKAVTDESMGATVLPLELADTGRGADARTGDVGLHIGNYVIQRQLGWRTDGCTT